MLKIEFSPGRSWKLVSPVNMLSDISCIFMSSNLVTCFHLKTLHTSDLEYIYQKILWQFHIYKAVNSIYIHMEKYCDSFASTNERVCYDAEHRSASQSQQVLASRERPFKRGAFKSSMDFDRWGCDFRFSCKNCDKFVCFISNCFKIVLFIYW